jgi:drug/metabolite transporter (DMT)-like permease
MKRSTLLILLSYLLVYIVWGSTYFFIKAAVETIPPTLVVGGRFILGAVILAVIAGFRGGFRILPTRKELAGAAVLGILLLLLGNGLVTLAQKSLPSWVSSVVVACMPIYVAFYNLVLYRTRISGIRLGGALAGIAGVTLILMGREAGVSAFGPTIFITVAGALCWALGTSIARSLPKPQEVLVSTAIQMTVAGLVSLAIALAGGANAITVFSGASLSSLAAFAYLVLAGALAMVAYNHLLAMEPAFRISSYSLVNPLIAVSLGFAAGEPASPWFGLGAPLVLVGLVAILYGDVLSAKIARAGS